MYVESWFNFEIQILIEILQKVNLNLIQENHKFLMFTFQFNSLTVSVPRTLIDFNEF